ncbi:hypothetical protein EYF80_020208 [Liparis tanakae]|uniref:Uncharacterized protein n=1 Tax=Liparis tanakae TaxID=230148 RepID=A0A4Z2HX41_9TELE|nr:hypothetical protein EYF80_020208 [Liparis tanakae]
MAMVLSAVAERGSAMFPPADGLPVSSGSSESPAAINKDQNPLTLVPVEVLVLPAGRSLFFGLLQNTENIKESHHDLLTVIQCYLLRRRYDWLRDSLSSSSLRLRSNRCVSDSRTDGIGRRVTAASESVRSCLRESIHWLFLEDCWMNSALCCCSVANESRS